MADRVGQRLGNYRLIRLLGRGGFAEVYLGEHLRLKTQAAIKVLHTSTEDNDAQGFLREAQTVARLKHPHIVRVLDFDVEDHTPFLVMDYLPNGNIRRSYPKGTSLPLETIVSYIKQLASALQYAHNEKLIHRDIKPENMLLDKANTIILSDFGIALMAQSSRYQSTQEVAGTAAYMAPEQFQGHPRRASDQYALGVVVYEWLTGDRPFHGTFSEIASQHLFVPPPPLREKVPTISPDIEQVVLTVLEKNPQKRFASIQAFATAFAQAYQLSLSTLPLALVQPSELSSQSQPQLPPNVLLPPSSTRSSQAAKAKYSPSHLSHSTKESIVSSPPLTPPSGQEDVLSNSLRPPPQSQTSISRRTVVTGLVSLAIVGSGLTWFISTHNFSSSSVIPSLTKSVSSPNHSSAAGTPEALLYTYHGHNSGVTDIAWSPDSRRIASSSSDKTVQVWNAVDGGNIFIYRGHKDNVNGVAWSPDGKYIASASDDSTVQVWDAGKGVSVYIYGGPNISTNPGNAGEYAVYKKTVAWSPNGNYIASVNVDQGLGYSPDVGAGVTVWNIATNKTFPGDADGTNFVHAITWAPDSGRIASADDDGKVRVWNIINGNVIYIYNGHASSSVYGVAWSPNDKRIASGGNDHTVQVWDATSGDHVFIYSRHSAPVTALAWSPDGKRIASADFHYNVQVWNAMDGSLVGTYQKHSDRINAIAWSPDGKYIASASDDKTVEIWQTI